MTRLLFAHDDRVLLDAAGTPTSNNYTRHLVDRYRYLADHVTFAVRCSATECVDWYPDASLHCIPDMKHGRDVLRYGAARAAVRSLVDSHDIVVARLPSIIGSWALRAAWRARKPVMVEMVGCSWDALWNHSPKGKLAAPWFWLKNRHLLRRSQYTVYVTERFLQHRYPTLGASIGCSNVETTVAPMSRTALRAARLRDLATHQPVVLGTIANVDVPYKGHDLVLRALASMPHAATRFRYRIVGPGNPGRLARMAESLGVSAMVEFTGGIPRASVPSVLDDIDIYVHASRQEGLPRAMIEAMARGCVVIGARTGGIPELIDEPWLVPRNDWRGIANVLSRLDELDLQAASRKNTDVAMEYTIDRLNLKRRAFYDRFLSAHGLVPAMEPHDQHAT